VFVNAPTPVLTIIILITGTVIILDIRLLSKFAALSLPSFGARATVARIGRKRRNTFAPVQALVRFAVEDWKADLKGNLAG